MITLIFFDSSLSRMSGSVSQVMGAVVDCVFPPDKMPSLFNALHVQCGDKTLTLEVQQHLDGVLHLDRV